MNRKERRAGKAGGPGAGAISPLLSQALQLHQAGRLAEAESAYARLLSQNGRDADALYLLGVLKAQKGALAEAERLLKQAVQARAVFPDAWFNLGVLYLQGKFLAEAEPALRTCLKQQPQHAGALWNLGNLCLDLEKFAEAETLFRQLLRQQPGNADVLHGLAMALLGERKFKEAEATARQALTIGRQTKTRGVLGHALYVLGQFEEAEIELRAAIKEFPKDVEPRTLLASLLRRCAELEEAYRVFVDLVRDFPDDPVVRLNFSMCLKDMGRLDEALDEADAALRLAPDDADLRINRSHLLLQAGRLREGWQDYHYRFHTKLDNNRRMRLPMPDIADQSELKDHSVLVWPEQGIGDQITYASAMGELIADAKSVEILSAPKLASLFRRTFPQARIITDAKDSSASRNMPFGELFVHYRPDIMSFAKQKSYLTADATAVAQWKERLRAFGPGLKVGIGWRSTTVSRERKKHFFDSLLPWAPILSASGVTFINYQPKSDPHELDQVGQALGCRIEQFDDIDLFDDLDASAALGSALDLVICNGSANAFLAAACGTPVWLFYVSDSHWDRLGTEGIPWLPSLVVVERLWNEGWGPAVERIAAALKESVQRGRLIAPQSSSPLRGTR